MLLYFIPILTLFYFSKFRLAQSTNFCIVVLLMLFLCFGYMTGSDWRSYELMYYDGFVNRSVEPGYMFLSKLCSSLGINFWLFHIVIKCVVYGLIIWFFSIIHIGNYLFTLGLWYASYGLYMFIDCPFRNLIACGISVVAFYFLFTKNWIKYYIISFLVISFHLSGVVLFVLPLLRFQYIESKKLVMFYLGILLIMAIVGPELLKSIIAYLPPIFSERIDFYESSTSIISIGLIPRFICLYLIINNRNKLETNYLYGKDLFNLAYIFLLISLIYYAFPMLFRSALFLGPFYVSAIAIGLENEIHKKKLRFIIMGIFMAVVFTTVRTYKFVPYTNILYNCVTGDFYDYNYRNNYNIINTPYK